MHSWALYYNISSNIPRVSFCSIVGIFEGTVKHINVPLGIQTHKIAVNIVYRVVNWERVCTLYREAGRMDYLRTVGTFHQSEGGVSGFLLIGLLADLTYCRQRKAWLEETERKIMTHIEHI